MSSVKFKLNLAAKSSPHKMNYKSKILLMGSCFTENIGGKLDNHLFQTFQNSHGILFNPVSVQNAITDSIQNKKYQTSDLFFLNDVWNSWYHHSRFSGITQVAALEKINESINQAHLFLKTASHLVITLGSAWLYTLNENAPNGKGLVVANNHKAPAQWFTKQLLSPSQLLNNLKVLVADLNQFNPDLKIIFTISPVRHLREGLVDNNRSKAVLIQAVHDFISNASGDTQMVEYFPAYEYVIDDLRDYRFYAEDLVHPNYAATQYVWEQLVETYMHVDTQLIMKQVAELQLAVNHKPFFSGSTEHQKFIQSCIEKTIQLQAQIPSISLQNQLQFFKSQVAK